MFSLSVTNPSFNVLFEMSQSQPLDPQVQEVMLMGCEWWISIHLVCLARRKTNGERKGSMHDTEQIFSFYVLVNF